MIAGSKSWLVNITSLNVEPHVFGNLTSANDESETTPVSNVVFSRCTYIIEPAEASHRTGREHIDVVTNPPYPSPRYLPGPTLLRQDQLPTTGAVQSTQLPSGRRSPIERPLACPHVGARDPLRPATRAGPARVVWGRRIYDWAALLSLLLRGRGETIGSYDETSERAIDVNSCRFRGMMARARGPCACGRALCSPLLCCVSLSFLAPL